MPTIIFTTPDGKEHNVTVDEGVTVMEAGRDANLGIEGTCGGCLSCATCHVIVDPDWYAKTGGPSEDEEDMLDRIAFDLGADFIATQLNYLTDSERFVVEHYYGIDKKEPISMTKVGKLHGVSRERCRQLHLRALIKLRINSAVPA